MAPEPPPAPPVIMPIEPDPIMRIQPVIPWCQRMEDTGAPMSILEPPSNPWACRETPDRGDRGQADRGSRDDRDSSQDADPGDGRESGPDTGSMDGGRQGKKH